jgi:nucleoside-diphosphate-sugar epimerase
MKKKKNILIIGGAGFIGSHITKWLLDLNYRVHIIDKEYNYMIGGDEPKVITHYGRSRLLDNYNDKNLIRYNIDLVKEKLPKFKKHFFDCCIHLASPVGVNNILNQNTIADALTINLKVYNFIEKSKIPLVFASSSEVFGENGDIIDNSPISISNPLLSKRGGYASQKLVSEFLFRELPNVQIVRFFNITGIGHEPESGMVLPTLIHNVINNKPCIINPKIRRVFTNIESKYVKPELLKIIECSKNRENLIFNIGFTVTDQNICDNYLTEVLSKIIKICKKEDLYSNLDMIKYTKVYKEEINKRMLKNMFIPLTISKYNKKLDELISDMVNYQTR